MISVL